MASAATKAICSSVLYAHRSDGWRAEVEARFGTRRIDVLVIAPRGKRVIGFEIKSEYGDFRSEVKNPSKTNAVLDFCTEFYFVTPPKMVSPEEIPLECGLIYHYGNPYGLRVIKRSPHATWYLPFEEHQILNEEFYPQTEWEYFAASQASDEVNIPRWMLPRYNRPLRFQFDVAAVAVDMAPAVLPDFDLTAGMEAF